MPRGFEICKPFSEPLNGFHVTLPKRATAHSAGYDFFALDDVVMEEGEIKPIRTGIKSYMNEGEFLMLANRSSNPKKGLELANGVGIVDKDYYSNPDNDGHIMFLFKATKLLRINAGDKIGQGIFMQYLTTDTDETTAVRGGGFGSTDKEN